MPGVEEIRQTISIIKNAPGIGNQVELLPLHANLTNDEQRKVFQPTAKRKVVVATNVAEVSFQVTSPILVTPTPAYMLNNVLSSDLYHHSGRRLRH